MQKLNPFFISGFSDAESCFYLSLDSNYRPRFSFSIGLNIKDQDIILKLNSFFNNQGRISTYKPHNEIRVTFENLGVINNEIIPHFDSYPLLGVKYLDYQLFKLGINLINGEDYKSVEGLRNFSKFALLMNEGNKKNIIEKFPDLLDYYNPNHDKFYHFKEITGLDLSPVINPIINPWWLTGFIAGDGCFSASVKDKGNSKLAFQPSLSISQHKNNIILFENIKKYFNCGNVYKKASNGLYPHIQYQVSSTKEIKKNILCHFENYPLMSYKENVYRVWSELINLLSQDPSEIRNAKAIKLINQIKELNK